MRVVELIMDRIAKDPYNKLDPILVRQWALTFIQNGGIFNNHFYKKREITGVITDPTARGDMKRWMI
jgi:hypothetical protein